jgi:molybdopterin-synthase adenylyltransferase
MIGARQIRRIFPSAKIVQVRRRWQSAASALCECDIVVGCLDTFDGRLQLEAFSRRYLMPYIDLGMDVYETDGGFGIAGQVALSMPGGPCLKCMNVIQEEWRAREAADYGAAGGRPQVVWPNGLLASLAVGVLVQLASPWHDSHQAVQLLEYDGNAQVVQRSTMLSDLEPCPHFESVDNVGDPWFRLVG